MSKNSSLVSFIRSLSTKSFLVRSENRLTPHCSFFLSDSPPSFSSWATSTLALVMTKKEKKECGVPAWCETEGIRSECADTETVCTCEPTLLTDCDLPRISSQILRFLFVQQDAQTPRERQLAAFGPNERLQGLAHGRRWFLFPLPGSNLDAIMWLESRKVLSKQHTSRSRVRDGVVMETQRLSSRLGTVTSTWAPEHVLFSHSGILEIPLRVPEPRWEDFYWSVIISLNLRCYMWS